MWEDVCRLHANSVLLQTGLEHLGTLIFAEISEADTWQEQPYEVVPNTDWRGWDGINYFYQITRVTHIVAFPLMGTWWDWAFRGNKCAIPWKAGRAQVCKSWRILWEDLGRQVLEMWNGGIGDEAKSLLVKVDFLHSPHTLEFASCQSPTQLIKCMCLNRKKWGLTSLLK